MLPFKYEICPKLVCECPITIYFFENIKILEIDYENGHLDVETVAV